MAPETVKRREYIGVCCILAGALFCMVGFAGVFFDLETALVSAVLGVLSIAAGIVSVRTIPDLVHGGDEL